MTDPARRLALAALLSALPAAAATPVSPQAFTKRAAAQHVLLTLPEGYESVPLLDDTEVPYDLALRHKKQKLELRITLDEPLPAGTLFPYLVAVVSKLEGKRPPPISPRRPGGAKAESDRSMMGCSTKGDFGRGYKQCFAFAFRGTERPVVLVFLLFDDLKTAGPAIQAVSQMVKYDDSPPGAPTSDGAPGRASRVLPPTGKLVPIPVFAKKAAAEKVVFTPPKDFVAVPVLRTEVPYDVALRHTTRKLEVRVALRTPAGKDPLMEAVLHAVSRLQGGAAGDLPGMAIFESDFLGPFNAESGTLTKKMRPLGPFGDGYQSCVVFGIQRTGRPVVLLFLLFDEELDLRALNNTLGMVKFELL